MKAIDEEAPNQDFFKALLSSCRVPLSEARKYAQVLQNKKNMQKRRKNIQFRPSRVTPSGFPLSRASAPRSTATKPRSKGVLGGSTFGLALNYNLQEEEEVRGRKAFLGPDDDRSDWEKSGDWWQRKKPEDDPMDLEELEISRQGYQTDGDTALVDLTADPSDDELEDELEDEDIDVLESFGYDECDSMEEDSSDEEDGSDDQDIRMFRF